MNKMEIDPANRNNTVVIFIKEIIRVRTRRFSFIKTSTVPAFAISHLE